MPVPIAYKALVSGARVLSRQALALGVLDLPARMATVWMIRLSAATG